MSPGVSASLRVKASCHHGISGDTCKEVDRRAKSKAAVFEVLAELGAETRFEEGA